MRIFSTISFAVKFGFVCLMVGLCAGIYLGANAANAAMGGP